MSCRSKVRAHQVISITVPLDVGTLAPQAESVMFNAAAPVGWYLPEFVPNTSAGRGCRAYLLFVQIFVYESYIISKYNYIVSHFPNLLLLNCTKFM